MKQLVNLVPKLFIVLLPGLLFAHDSFDEVKIRAEQGEAVAQWSLGGMYASGEGVLENDAEAVKMVSLSSRTRRASCYNYLLRNIKWLQ